VVRGAAAHYRRADERERPKPSVALFRSAARSVQKTVVRESGREFPARDSGRSQVDSPVQARGRATTSEGSEQALPTRSGPSSKRELPFTCCR